MTFGRNVSSRRKKNHFRKNTGKRLSHDLNLWGLGFLKRPFFQRETATINRTKCISLLSPPPSPRPSPFHPSPPYCQSHLLQSEKGGEKATILSPPSPRPPCRVLGHELNSSCWEFPNQTATTLKIVTIFT